jgi:cytochrome c-type biogenesis protein CcmH
MRASTKRSEIALFIVALMFLPLLAFGERDIEAEVRRIAADLRCPVCQNLSVADSPSELAQEMRNLIRERLLQGQSKEEIKAYFVSKYGEWVLLAPPRKGFNLVVWVLPFLAVLVGLGGIAVILHRWVRKGREREPLEEVDPSVEERLDRELEDLGGPL